jgi:hypothetical protein
MTKTRPMINSISTIAFEIRWKKMSLIIFCMTAVSKNDFLLIGWRS